MAERKLGNQWIEVIDGKKHMLKAVPSVDIGACTACDFEGQESKCAGLPNSVCGSNSNSFIIKDLGILNEGGLFLYEFRIPHQAGIHRRMEQEGVMIDQDARAKIISELMELQDYTDDIERTHAYADDILCELLKKLGFADVVDAWEAVPKWYG